MSFTAPIDPTSPVGTDQVSQGDNQLRALKLAIVERIDSMSDGVETDPIQIRQKAAEAIAVLQATRYNGTIADPEAVEANQPAGAFESRAFGATVEMVLARITGVAREEVTDEQSGGLWRVSVTRVGSDELIDLFDIQEDGSGNVEIVAVNGMQFSSTNGEPFDFVGELQENGNRVVATGFPTDDGQPEMYNAGVASGSGLEVDWANGPVQKLTLSANDTITFVNAKDGGTYMLLIIQGGGGGNTPNLVDWNFGSAAPVPWASGVGDKSLISALYDGDDAEYIAGVGHLSA